MSAWRRKAIELLPELRPIIEKADSPTALWIDLSAHFANIAAEAEDSTLRPILMYAFWCLSPAAGASPSEVSEAVHGGFFWMLARHKELWGRFRSWFSPSQFEQIVPAFMYSLSEKELKELKEAYYGSAKSRGRR